MNEKRCIDRGVRVSVLGIRYDWFFSKYKIIDFLNNKLIFYISENV